jgi:hypothetical protein
VPGESAQFLVDQWNQLGEGILIAALHLGNSNSLSR